MVVRTSPVGARAWSGRFFLSLSGSCLFLSSVAPLVAQTPPVVEPPVVEATTPPAVPAAQDAAAEQPTTFGRVVADKAMVTGYHFPFPAHGRLVKDGNGYVFKTGA